MSSTFNVNDKVFILDLEFARVFPAIVTEVIKVYPDVWWSRYKVKLDVTAGVHDALTFNGYAKPAPFDIPDDKEFADEDLFKDKVAAYQGLIRKYKYKQASLKDQLKAIPPLIKMAQDRINDFMLSDGLKYKIGDTAWLIKNDDYEVEKPKEVVIEAYDRGDLQNRPYYVCGVKDKFDHTWCSATQLYDSKDEAVKACKTRLHKAYEKQRKALEAV